MNKILLLSSLFLMPFQLLISQENNTEFSYFNFLSKDSLIKQKCQNLTWYHKIPFFKSETYATCDALHEILKERDRDQQFRGTGSDTFDLTIGGFLALQRKALIQNLLENESDKTKWEESDKFSNAAYEISKKREQRLEWQKKTKEAEEKRSKEENPSGKFW